MEHAVLSSKRHPLEIALICIAAFIVIPPDSDLFISRGVLVISSNSLSVSPLKVFPTGRSSAVLSSLAARW